MQCDTKNYKQDCCACYILKFIEKLHLDAIFKLNRIKYFNCGFNWPIMGTNVYYMTNDSWGK